jgi:hypothetical protein
VGFPGVSFPLATKDSSTSSFPIWVPFVSLSCLLALLWLAMLFQCRVDRVGSWCLCLEPDLRRLPTGVCKDSLTSALGFLLFLDCVCFDQELGFIKSFCCVCWLELAYISNTRGCTAVIPCTRVVRWAQAHPRRDGLPPSAPCFRVGWVSSCCFHAHFDPLPTQDPLLSPFLLPLPATIPPHRRMGGTGALHVRWEKLNSPKSNFTCCHSIVEHRPKVTTMTVTMTMIMGHFGSLFPYTPTLNILALSPSFPLNLWKGFSARESQVQRSHVQRTEHKVTASKCRQTQTSFYAYFLLLWFRGGGTQ